MTKRRAVWPWVVAGAALLTAMFVVIGVKKGGGPRPVGVRVEEVKKGRIESWVRAPGKVQPERLVQVSSNIMGRVRGLAVREGDRVHRGDLLLSLDDERYRSARSGMEAALQGAQADLDLAEAQLDLSQQTLARQEKLFTESLTSDESLQSARTQVKVAEARVTASRENLRGRRATLAETSKDLDETIFRAPLDGVVTALNVEEGENVMTGTMNNPGTVILTVADLDTMQVEADVDETDVVRIRPGLSARVRVDAWEDSVLAGTVTTVGMSGRRGAQSAQQQATNFAVEVRINTPPEGLRPGMSADVEILAGEKDSALVVPIQALTAQPERVWKSWQEWRANPPKSSAGRALAQAADTAKAGVNEKLVEGLFLLRSGKAVFVPVNLGLRGDTDFEVGGELKPGDKVITGPYRVLRGLRDGDAAKPEKPKAVGKSQKAASGS
jgi:HlyD family secretion protein